MCIYENARRKRKEEEGKREQREKDNGNRSEEGLRRNGNS